MPNYEIKEARERTELEKQLNAQIDKRLAKLKEIQSFNNDTAATIGQQYTQLQMIAQAEEAAFEAQKEAYDLLTLSSAEQEAKLASLEAATEAGRLLSEAQAEELDLLRQAQDVRAQGPEAYKQMVAGVRQQLVVQKQVTDEAKEQQQLNDVMARDIGVKFANSLGLVAKKQESITKQFMKSKNKALFLKNAVKGIASQVSLVNIGSKLMQSGFQMMVGLVTKVFGSGGGGGGKNLSEFVKMTGHASGQMYGLAKETARLARRLKVGFEEGGKAVADLMSNMSDFMTMNKRSQKVLATGAVKMMAFGVSAETSAQLYQKFTGSMEMSAKQAVKQQRQMFFEASKMGMNIAEYQEGFLKFTETVPGFGKAAVKAYREAAAAAKALGFRTAEALAKAADGFDNYEDSAKMAAQMNQVFGKQVFDSTKLMNASLEGGPGALAMEMNKQLAAAGENFGDMSRAQKLAMAEASGKSIDELEKLMKGQKGVDKMQAASKRINTVTNSVKKFNQAIKKTKPPGGGGQKSFLDMVLRSYNRLTKGRFFQKIRMGKKGLRDALKALADYIAEFIQDMEEKFQEGAKEFINKYRDTINSFGKMIGIDDLAGSLTKGLEAVKDMFPLLLPAIPMLLGGATAFLGILIKVAGALPGIIGGVVSLGKGMKNVAGRGLDVLKSLGGSGTMMDKLSGAWNAMTGKPAAKSLEEMAAEAKPVVVTNSRAQAVPVDGIEGKGGSDGGDAMTRGALGMLGARGMKLKGLGLSSAGRALVQSKATTAARGGAVGRLFQAAKGGWKGGRKSGIGGLRGMSNAVSKSFNRMKSMKALEKTPNMVKELANANKLLAARQAAQSATSAVQGAGKASGMLSKIPGLKNLGKAGGLMSGAGKALPVIGMLAGGLGAYNKVMEGDFTGALGDVAKIAIAATGPIGATAVLAYEVYDAMRDKQYPAMVDFATAMKHASPEVQKQALAAQEASQKTNELTAELNKEVESSKNMTAAMKGVVEKFYQKGKMTLKGKSQVELMGDLAGAVDSDGEVDSDKFDEIQNDIRNRLVEGRTKLTAVRGSALYKDLMNNEQNRKFYESDMKAGMAAHKKTMDAAKEALRSKLRSQDASQGEIADAMARFEAQRSQMNSLRKQELELEAIARLKNEKMKDHNAMAKEINKAGIEFGKQFTASEALYYEYLMARKNTGKSLDEKQKKALAKLQGKKDLHEIGFDPKTGMEAAREAYDDMMRDEFEKNLKGVDAGLRKGQGLARLKKETGVDVTDYDSYRRAQKAHSQLKAGAGAQRATQASIDALNAASTKAYNKFYDAGGKLKAEHAVEFSKSQQMKSLKKVFGDASDRQNTAAGYEAILEKYGRGDRKHTEAIMSAAQKQIEERIIQLAKDGKVMSMDEITKTLKEVAKKQFADVDKEANDALARDKAIKEKLEAQSYKVSQKDIDNLATYKIGLEDFAKTLVETDIGVKLAEFMVHMDKLKEHFTDSKATQASAFMENMGILFYNARSVSGSTGKNISKLGTAMQGMVEDADTEKFKAVATALASVGAVHVKPESKSAIDMLVKANEEFPKLKKKVDEMSTTTAGQLFFKGGTINQDINTTTTVKLVVGAREFGNATLHGLKETGHATVKAGGQA